MIIEALRDCPALCLSGRYCDAVMIGIVLSSYSLVRMSFDGIVLSSNAILGCPYGNEDWPELRDLDTENGLESVLGRDYQVPSRICRSKGMVEV